MSIVAALNVYHDDDSSRCAAMNMAIDESLLERAEIPSIPAATPNLAKRKT